MNTKERIIKQRKKTMLRTNIACTALAALTVSLSILMLVLGRTIYPLKDILVALQGHGLQGVSFAVVTLRLPRMLAGVLSGFAFGLAGSSFQSLLRNSLASPDVIGVTSGASAAAVVCMLIFGLSGAIVSTISVIAGISIALIIYLLAGKGSFGGGRLILIGIGIGSMLQSFISFILIKASQHELPAAMRWLTGSLNGIGIDKIIPLLVAVFLFGSSIVLLSKQMDMFSLGEEMATQLGVNVERTKFLIIISAVALSSFATSCTGPTAFVAFLSGPIAAGITGASRATAISSALVGAVLVLASDLIGQFAFDTRFPVGAITGVLGAPYLLFLLLKQNAKGGAI